MSERLPFVQEEEEESESGPFSDHFSVLGSSRNVAPPLTNNPPIGIPKPLESLGRRSLSENEIGSQDIVPSLTNKPPSTIKLIGIPKPVQSLGRRSRSESDASRQRGSDVPGVADVLSPSDVSQRRVNFDDNNSNTNSNISNRLAQQRSNSFRSDRSYPSERGGSTVGGGSSTQSFASNKSRFSFGSNNSISSNKSRFSLKESIARLTRNSSSLDDDVHAVQTTSKSVFRGYVVGDSVLINDHMIRWANQVNKYGYPPGQGNKNGNGNAPEEQRGPYLYVLGKVTKVHFEEYSVYYTVAREDTGQGVRGEVDSMEPIRSSEGEEAARKSARDFMSVRADEQGNEAGDGDCAKEDSERQKLLRVIGNICVILLLPLLLLYDCFVFVIGARLFRIGRVIFKSMRRQAKLFLNGMKPYECSARITMVNVVVLCSTWYMFIDQARLAFFPANADYTLACINCGMWTILLLELLFEVFIRPNGYHKLIQSDKAFAPTTVRYISSLHLVIELISLAFFVPEFLCLFTDQDCRDRTPFSLMNSALLAVTGPSRNHALAGRIFFVLIRLRVFGLVRHWKNMWINNTFLKRQAKFSTNTAAEVPKSIDGSGRYEAGEIVAVTKTATTLAAEQKERDAALISASNIGTALMVTNSYRALMILCAIMGLFPMISLIHYEGVTNSVATEMVKQLQATNLLVTVENSENCDFLVNSVEAWIGSFDSRDKELIASGASNFVVSLAIRPARCFEDFEDIAAAPYFPYSVGIWDYETLEYMSTHNTGFSSGEYIVFSLTNTFDASDLESMANGLNLRIGALQTEYSDNVVQSLELEDGSASDTLYQVAATFNQSFSIQTSALASFLLQVCLLVTVLVGLSVLRRDAESLVLKPLRSMLKIVARYAKNPLASDGTSGKGEGASEGSDSESEAESWDAGRDDTSEADKFGNYETEQLIRAVSIITELLRLCWGVAGADIISTNLASREGALAEVFNPTVPGKSVYALFAFAAINGYDHALKCLGGDVVILINDVAAVLHGEVFRWGFGDSGQCNKNLGAAFLMVFRIGLVKEVVEKLHEATNVVFATAVHKKTARKKLKPGTAASQWGKISKHRANQDSAITNAMQLSLQSLPGISTFTDRAVIGMLKSFAGIHRDNKLRSWSRDFRLSAGVGAFSVDMIFGMDAGWAVEGAVGSEYKIDATYLSPHVNMASRMMSACKQYGVTILLSEAVQELMSDVARTKLRNIDRVTVKGSTRIQKIFTYDARQKGADFFLFSRADDQADMEAERYVPSIWHTDQDLNAMRHHVTDDFEMEFNAGMKAYLEGDWPMAIERLETANEIMVDAAMDEGYLHDEQDDSPDRKEMYRSETADGPSVYLVQFMKSKGGVAPSTWAGWHPLLNK